MTILREIWHDIREFYRPIIPWFLVGFGLLVASALAQRIHPWLAEALGHCGVGCIAIMFLVFFHRLWKRSVARDGLKATRVTWILALLILAAYEYWRYER